MQRFEEVRPEWYVVFSEAKYNHWVFSIIDRRMGHVYAVQSLNNYQWLVVQPRVNITETKILLKCQYPTIYDITDEDDKVVRVKVKQCARVRGTFNFFNCVEQVKALLGIKSALTLTPTQLYNGLMGGRYG